MLDSVASETTGAGPIARIEGLRVEFQTKEGPVVGVEDVSFDIGPGETVCVVGESGSGKSVSSLSLMRLVEYGQRLQHQRRGICRADSGRIDRPLLAMSTVHGGCSLGLPVGRLEVGYYGDLVLVDRTVPSLAGVAEEDLTAAIILGAAEECICTTLVGGRA